jgi:hypothetical protein
VKNVPNVDSKKRWMQYIWNILKFKTSFTRITIGADMGKIHFLILQNIVLFHF